MEILSWATPGITGSGVRENCMRLRRPYSRASMPLLNPTRTEDYKAYVEAVKAVRPNTLRDLLERIPTGKEPIPIEEVEPIEEIRRRFTTAGMSLGALSPEAHECLAIAMNQDRRKIQLG